MTKEIGNKLFTYTFTRAGKVQCIVDDGSLKIWVNGDETTANTYKKTGQATSQTFPSSTPLELPSAEQGKNWVLHIMGLNSKNKVIVTVPALGTWSPNEPPNT